MVESCIDNASDVFNPMKHQLDEALKINLLVNLIFGLY